MTRSVMLLPSSAAVRPSRLLRGVGTRAYNRSVAGLRGALAMELSMAEQFRHDAGKSTGFSSKGPVLEACGEHTRPRLLSLAPKTFGCGLARQTQEVSGGGAGNRRRGRVRSPRLSL
jgi:hypothetical protein